MDHAVELLKSDIRVAACAPPPHSVRSARGHQRVIKESEANKQQQINEAQGQAAAILAVATATAEGLRRVGESLNSPGGMAAMQLRIAEEYVKQFGHLADEAASTLVIPANLSDIASMIAVATSVVKTQNRPA